jgi:hypothetical protein
MRVDEDVEPAGESRSLKLRLARAITLLLPRLALPRPVPPQNGCISTTNGGKSGIIVPLLLKPVLFNACRDHLATFVVTLLCFAASALQCPLLRRSSVIVMP